MFSFYILWQFQLSTRCILSVLLQLAPSQPGQFSAGDQLGCIHNNKPQMFLVFVRSRPACWRGGWTYLVACSSTADAKGHGSPTANMRVIALWQQRHHTGTLLWGSDKGMERHIKGMETIKDASKVVYLNQKYLLSVKFLLLIFCPSK